jgi:hypothetical protein
MTKIKGFEKKAKDQGPVLLKTHYYDQILFWSLLSNLGQFNNGFNRFKKNLKRYIQVSKFKRND